ncbi:MAG: hypothetical protein FRX48_01865 [Lasallia pustulata]|uniref:Mob1/phocein n=1 Tax=Lasallia pustulata TaxID=136370 RepID=A0A5M8PZD7_9LECA|nr:MAG: hypothetical protein FRX48_01865 [Lasallia pustulata]
MAAVAGPVSPSSSPRLPSPPPFPEVQIGPKSPTVGGPSGSMAAQEFEDAAKHDTGAMRRIRPGTKAADMASGPPLVPLSELDSPFQLQEHLKALYYHHTKSENLENTIPVSRETAHLLATPPDNVDRSLWLYELCRFLVQKANNLIVAFFAESPPCSAQTCPEMRASEWQYLCAVHDPPKSCCAIDYCCHTLDWAGNILTSQKHFPSRLTLGSDAAGGSQQGVRQLTNIFRRVYRIFAHAWFQHRQVFWHVEGQEGLYIFFKTVCDDYNLIPEDNYTISPEAEGIVTHKETPQNEPESKEIMKSNEQAEEGSKGDESDATTTISTGATTRRHKHTPSLGSAVTTIMEGDEEDSKGQEHKAEPLPNHDQELPIIPTPQAEQAKKEDETIGKGGLDPKTKDLDAQDKAEHAEVKGPSNPIVEAEEAEKPSESAKDVTEVKEVKEVKEEREGE